MAIKRSCMNFVFLTLYAWPIFKKYMGTLHNKACFHKIIKGKGNNPMFWLKLYIIINILINFEKISLQVLKQGLFLWGNQNKG